MISYINKYLCKFHVKYLFWAVDFILGSQKHSRFILGMGYKLWKFMEKNCDTKRGILRITFFLD
jgi:hypothetical protein